MKIIIIILLLVMLYAGYFVFMSTLDVTYKPKPSDVPVSDEEDPNDLMGPTGKRLEKYQIPLKEAFSALPWQRLEITSFDGLKLYGYLLEGKSDEAVILIHGFKSSKENDFCDKIRIYQERGTTVLAIDQRAQGQSEGRYIGFSELERFDVKQWAEVLRKRLPDAKIWLHGVSMGGATAVHCSAMDIPGVVGIIDDCGFTSIKGITENLITTMFHIPYFPLGYLAAFFSKLIAGIDFFKSDGVVEVTKTDKPILFIHGDADRYVPMWMSEKMYEACVSPKKLYIVKGAGHAAAYMMDETGYTKTVNEFMDGQL